MSKHRNHRRPRHASASMALDRAGAKAKSAIQVPRKAKSKVAGHQRGAEPASVEPMPLTVAAPKSVAPDAPIATVTPTPPSVPTLRSPLAHSEPAPTATAALAAKQQPELSVRPTLLPGSVSARGRTRSRVLVVLALAGLVLIALATWRALRVDDEPTRAVAAYQEGAW